MAYNAQMLRWLAAASALCVLAVPSFASYELGLMMQGTKVHRYDPISGAYFGSFDLLAGGVGMTAYRSTGLAYVLGGTSISRYDYSTGVSRGRFSIPSGAQSIREGMNDDELLIGYADRVERRSAATGSLLGAPISVGPGGGGYDHSQGAIALRSQGRYFIVANDPGSDDFLIEIDETSSILGINMYIGPWSSSVSTLYGGDSDGDAFTLLSRNNWDNWNTSVSEFTTAPGVPGVTVGYDATLYLNTRPASVQYGHEGALTFLVNPTGQWQMLRSYPESLSAAPPRTLSFLDGAQNVQGYTLLVAPEPATLTGLSLGALALLRRRRR